MNPVEIKGWWKGPAVFMVLLAALLTAWALVEPATLVANFDNDGRSLFELATLPFYLAIVPVVWWKCPFSGSVRRRRILSVMVTVVALMAVVKELDLHSAALHYLFPDYVGESGSLLPGLVKPNGKPLSGTPFKMRVLTNAAVPFGMKAAIVFYFTAFFGVFAAGFAYLLPVWIRGVFALRPAAWSIGCFGASGMLVQISDRLPAWLGHAEGLGQKSGDVTCWTSLCTALEEGGEMMIAIFALLAMIQSYAQVKLDESR